ncbi:hypothetical protein [Desulfopila sp. IMCC35008]|uniref:hypothetical protein n=1 Tax=Desulfopila sp. IMCC35008 TaxID=2653858 RepID=UPI0013D80FE1|nr:hypothetical protein [Desulfopila sp. IMCC35008]
MKYKTGKSLILALLLLAVCLQVPRDLLFDNSLFRKIDVAGDEYVQQGLMRAASAFAMARTFNGVVSVFRESELQLEPGGIGVSLALGAALDPVNDLVERFSWVMLASLTSLGSQQFLIEITPFISTRIVLTGALFCLLLGVWLPETQGLRLGRIGSVLLLSAVVLRFGVPAMAYLNEQVYIVFLQDQHNESMEALAQTVAEMESQQYDSMAEGANPEELGVWDRARNLVNSTMDQGVRMLDVNSRIEAVKRASLDLIDRVVDLIVVFFLSAIALPLLFLWGIIRLSRLFFHFTLHH